MEKVGNGRNHVSVAFVPMTTEKQSIRKPNEATKFSTYLYNITSIVVGCLGWNGSTGAAKCASHGRKR